MKNWECDKKKYDVYLPQVKALLGENLIQVTPEKLDQEQCSDLYSLSLAPITIAVRLRSLTYSERFSDEFTIRYRRSSGAQTEFSKIIDGWGTYFFYGFVDHTHKSIVKWLLIDLNKFDFNDFLTQIQQIKKMGNLKDLMGMIPGLGKMMKEIDIDDNAFKGVEAIIHSMTPQERAEPALLNGRRKERIARGSGSTIQEVNKLIKQFEDMRKMMKMMGNKQNMAKMMQNMPKMGPR